MPLKRIAAALGVSVSSAFLWTKDIELTAQQRAHNLRGPKGPLNKQALQRRAATWSERCRSKRSEFQAEGRLRARRREPLHLAGCMLYWAEGSKARNSVKFSNSDPGMLRLFRRFLTDALLVSRADIRLSLNVYTGNGLSIDEIEQHWLSLLALPGTCLRKHTLNHWPTSSSGRASNKLPYGVCTLRVESTRVVQHIFGAIQEYAGFAEPRWLDGRERRRGVGRPGLEPGTSGLKAPRSAS
jgi:hypothetical protein